MKGLKNFLVRLESRFGGNVPKDPIMNGLQGFTAEREVTKGKETIARFALMTWYL
jgi:hypothetical protein